MPSSVVAAVRYDPDRAILRVVYVSGKVYDYKEVPEKIYLSMKAATSKGNYLNKHVKGHFPFEKIE